jgi:RNA recognition motif-containing protein
MPWRLLNFCYGSHLYLFEFLPIRGKGAVDESFIGGLPHSFTHSIKRSPTMGNKLYVGNLPYGVDDAQLKAFFESCGTVVSATVIMDKFTGRSKGFGFVEMSNDQEAQAGITTVNGKEVEGRALTVNEARPKPEGGAGGGGRGGFRGGFRSGGGGGGGNRW